MLDVVLQHRLLVEWNETGRYGVKLLGNLGVALERDVYLASVLDPRDIIKAKLN